MQIKPESIEELNDAGFKLHQANLEALSFRRSSSESIINRLILFQIAIPSWALGTGGTRFGRFPGCGEPGSLEQKLEDVALINSLTRSAGAISLHIPWDIPKNTAAIRTLASDLGIRFDAVNSNTFQDQPGQLFSYKFGSMQHVDARVRQQAIDHNLEVISYGKELGSQAITIWLADGSCFPGQLNFRKAFENTLSCLEVCYQALPEYWKIYIEYKAFEPNYYSMTVGDWGQSLLYASKLGPKAYTLVDLGHHLSNANIEQIVALLLMEGKLGGFHFNDSKYADDDLTVGSINPYQLFLIFNELVAGMDHRGMQHHADLGWMIDASHNIKDPLEDLMQSLEAIQIAYARALLIDQSALSEAQAKNDVVMAQEILQDAFHTDVRPLIAEARRRTGGALEPIKAFRSLGCRLQLTRERGSSIIATGL